MTFQARIEQRPNTLGVDDRVWVLEDGRGSFAEIAPGFGFNCYRWHVPGGELLYADPKFFEEHQPTRSGFPILFPFPNRIKDGRFTWDGKEYQLPTNDPSGRNAIHGFVCRKPWQVVDQGAEGQSAWVTGEFVGSIDAPETLESWPADYRIAVTYRMLENTLEVDAEVSNPGSKDLPWGLGYHPYFALSLFGGNDARVTIPAKGCWELKDNIPTGRQYPVDEKRDLSAGKRYGELQLDDLFTDRDYQLKKKFCDPCLIAHENQRLEIYTSVGFQYIVGFTPPHRQAICMEPYTCTTDAINLHQRRIAAGLRVLRPGAVFSTVAVRLVYRH
jgi:aldose 1-epimerase